MTFFCKSNVSRSQIVSVILSLTILGVAFSWTPANAEEVIDQEEDVCLFLFSENGIGKLHTRESGGHGDTETVRIQPNGGNVFFALNFSLQSDLLAKSYRSDVGFHIYLHGSTTSFFDTGELQIHIRDGTTMTNGEIIASGTINIPTFGSASEVHVDVPWEDSYGPEYTFDVDNYIVLELVNDESTTVDINLDSGMEQGCKQDNGQLNEGGDGETASRIIINTNPVTDIVVVTESYNLETVDSEDKLETTNFDPYLPAELSKIFVSAEATNAFGTYDITSFKVYFLDPSGDELFVGEQEVDEPSQVTGTNIFDDIIWNYNDPVDTGSNQNGKGTYTAKVAAVDQQGNEFSLNQPIQMDAYGVYLSTPEPEQSVAVGGQVEYQIFVLNSGDENDVFTITPSETSDNWEVEPESWTSSSLGRGDEQAVTFTISAADSTEMVGKNTAVVFTAQSQNSVTPVNFDLSTKISVGAEYELSLFFDDPVSGQAVTNLNANGVAGEWNPYSLSIANLGQDTDSALLIAQVGGDDTGDWGVKFEYGDSNSGSITVPDIPRAGDGNSVVNVTVWVKPGVSGDTEFAPIQIIGTSQGNDTKRDTAILSLTRTFGLVFSVTPQGSSGIFVNKQAGESFNIDMLLESAVQDDHTIILDVESFPSGWSYNYKDETGATVTEVSLAGGESKVLDLLVTVGSQATYDEEGYSFKAVASALSDSNLIGRQSIEVFLKLTDGFTFSSLKYKEEMGPGDKFVFLLNLENNANGDDRFTLSAPSVPSGWRVVFPKGQIFDVPAGRSTTAEIEITASDDSRDGDQVTIDISIRSDLSNSESTQSFVVEIEQGFTAKLVNTFSDLWYIFAFLGIIMVIGYITYSRQDDDWEYEDDDEDSSYEEETTDEPEDDWDDWN